MASVHIIPCGHLIILTELFLHSAIGDTSPIPWRLCDWRVHNVTGWLLLQSRDTMDKPTCPETSGHHCHE